MKSLIKLLVIVCGMMLCTNNAKAQTFVMWGAATPVATLSSSDPNDTICVGSPIVFTAAIQAGSTYQFFVNGTSMQGPSGSNTYVPSPAFTVGNQQVVVLVDNGSCNSRDTVNFVTLALPIPTLAVLPGSTICVGTSVTFTAGGGTLYNFKVGGVSVQNGASNTYTTAALTNGQIVTVDVTNAGGCIATSAGITMTVNPLPTPTLAVAPSNNVCAATAVTFTASGGVNYNFMVNGVSMQNSSSPTYTTSTLTNGQIVTVVVTNATGCIATSAGITMTVNALPTAATVTGNPVPNCVGNLVNISYTGLTGLGPWKLEIWTDVAGNPGILYYAVPGTVASPSGTVQVPIPAIGFTTMHLRITDANGCSNF